MSLLTLSLGSRMGVLAVRHGGRASSILGKWVWAGDWGHTTLLAPQGASGAGLCTQVCTAVAGCRLPRSPSSFSTRWLPVWPGSVPGQARLSASPETMRLCVTKKRSLHAANVTQLDQPSIQEDSHPESAPVPPWLVKHPPPRRKKKAVHNICRAWLWFFVHWLLYDSHQGLRRSDGAFKPPNCFCHQQDNRISPRFQPTRSPSPAAGILGFLMRKGP